MTSVVVVGGGITGLAAARSLAAQGWSVTVLEAGPGWGGKVGGLEVGGVRLDSGAESMLARRPEGVALARDLGLGAALVHPTDAQPELLIEGRARVLPPTVLGVPVDVEALNRVLSPGGWARAQREPDLPAPPLPGDVAIGRLVDERFGPEVTDRLVEPLLGGVYAGHARKLSLQATSPQLFARAQTGGSLLAAAAAQARPEAGTPVFAGLAGGVNRLVDALLVDLCSRGVHLRSRATATSVATASGGYVLGADGAGGALTLRADAVVVTTPARAFARLLQHLVPAAAGWAGVPYASVALITMVVAGLEPGPSGLLIPPGELPSIKALTYSSTKWAWVADAAEEQYGPGVSIVRASVGRLGEEHLLQHADDALIARTFREAAGLPGWESARLRDARVTRWGGGLPQYGVGHAERVRDLRAALADHPGLAVAGAMLDGVGVAACVGSATLAVQKVRRDAGGPEISSTAKEAP